MANIMIDGISMSASPQYLINYAISMPRMALNHELISNSGPLGFSRQISGLLQGALSLSSVCDFHVELFVYSPCYSPGYSHDMKILMEV